MQAKIIDFETARKIKQGSSLAGVVPELLNWKGNCLMNIVEDSFCRKRLTGEYFYIPNNYLRRGNEIEVINKEGNAMFVSIDALQPYPLLYDPIKVIGTSDKIVRHRIIPPCWSGKKYNAVWEKKGILTHEPRNKSKIIIVFDEGITWETNLHIN